MISEYFEFIGFDAFPIYILAIFIVGIIIVMLYNFINDRKDNIWFFIKLLLLIIIILAVYIGITFKIFIDYNYVYNII